MKKLMFAFVLGIFFISFVLAQNVCGNDNSFLGTFQQNQNISLRQVCDTCTFVNLTAVTLPNGSTLNYNTQMTKNGINFNTNFQTTNLLGCYSYDTLGDKGGTNVAETIDLQITVSGKTTTTGNSILSVLGVLFFFVLGMLSVVLIGKQKKTPVKWTFALMGFIFFIAALNLVSVIIPDALINENVVSFFDSFTAISFVMLWFAFALIAIMWIFTFFQTIFYKKTLRQMEKYG